MSIFVLVVVVVGCCCCRDTDTVIIYVPKNGRGVLIEGTWKPTWADCNEPRIKQCGATQYSCFPCVACVHVTASQLHLPIM